MSAMIESTKRKTGNPASSPMENPNFEMPKFGETEVPAAFRGSVEQGIAQTKDAFQNAKAATEKATDLLQHTYTVATKGAAEYNLKIIEIARINANAAFDYVHELLGVKSLSEFVELSSTRARKQFEAITAQTKELTTLAQKVSIESAEPLKAGIVGAFNKIT